MHTQRLAMQAVAAVNPIWVHIVLQHSLQGSKRSFSSADQLVAASASWSAKSVRFAWVSIWLDRYPTCVYVSCVAKSLRWVLDMNISGYIYSGHTAESSLSKTASLQKAGTPLNTQSIDTTACIWLKRTHRSRRRSNTGMHRKYIYRQSEANIWFLFSGDMWRPVRLQRSCATLG